MCGIAGYISRQSLDSLAVLESMCAALAHRGPDGAGVWLDPTAGLALGHRRLAIIDLSSSGAQPMMSASGRYVIVLNGEIYNFEALRKELGRARGKPWRGTSDTEVALEAIETWGFEQALKQFIGMFAFGLWDRRERTLTLARDRMGEKPLYYGTAGLTFIFGSELKALTAFPGADFPIDRHALSAFLQFGYVPAPLSIYRNVRKLPPGSYLAASVLEDGAVTVSKPTRYWSLDLPQTSARARVIAGMDEKELVDALDARLSVAIRRQMVADVPLGAFLSGGIDSSTIVSVMQSQSSRPIRTFTIGFHEQSHDEAPYSKQVARHLGTDHTELYIKAAEAAVVIPRLSQIYDEPFADSSGIPTFLVSQLTRQHVTVSLSGDGGDELFGGYPRYQFCHELWQRLRRLPRWSRGAVSGTVTRLSPLTWDIAFKYLLSESRRQQVNGHRMHRLARVLWAETFDELYLRLISQWHDEDGIVLQSGEGLLKSALTPAPADPTSILNRMRQFDLEQYLPDDLLTKVDRASMVVSLESRAPFLDHEIVEFAWALPEQVLIRQQEGKWILRQVLDRYVPRSLVERPKAGFAIPIARWLLTDLRAWAEGLLEERALRIQGYLNPKPIRRMWQEHLSGQYDRHPYLWNVLMFQAWLEKSQHE